MHDCVVVHYGEIGTKGKNRGFFENKLMDNIKKIIDTKIDKQYGRLVLEGNPKNLADLSGVLGIVSFSPAVRTELDIEKIKDKALLLAKENPAGTFAIETKRSNKNFTLDSKQINRIVGEHVAKNTGMKVDLNSPVKKIFIEVSDKECYIYDKKIPGPGGLPVGVSGTVVSLLSGGIDSPVASYLMMKRGCNVVFVHFHNYTSKIEEKIEKLVAVLNKYQYKSKLYMVPFFPIQEKIIEKIPETHRMIVYRRVMMRIAGKIAEKEGAKALVTGDNLAQVASQTLDNLDVIHSASNETVFSPLIGMDKNDIIDIAKNIATYDLSILPYPDCCTYMIAKHPETRAKKEEIESMEKELDIKALVDYGIEKAEVKEISA
ncbi:MAG: tRNA 4-thiouridine(8) synthase ThiI [Candidatus Aenigmarchaeota archaeon]|nr:tRNA 4-thiouridine(8) synthase ThiI [Candidatus Aenigmarchaeota archaeon]